MVYNVVTNKEVKADIEKAITASEQKPERAIIVSEQETRAELDNLKLAITASDQKTKAELDNLKLAMELTIQRQIGEVNEIRSLGCIII